MGEHSCIYYGCHFYFLRSSPYNILFYYFFPFSSHLELAKLKIEGWNVSVPSCIPWSEVFCSDSRPGPIQPSKFSSNTHHYIHIQALDHIWCFPANPLSADHRSVKRQPVSSVFDFGLCVPLRECTQCHTCLPSPPSNIYPLLHPFTPMLEILFSFHVFPLFFLDIYGQGHHTNLIGSE